MKMSSIPLCGLALALLLSPPAEGASAPSTSRVYVWNWGFGDFRGTIVTDNNGGIDDVTGRPEAEVYEILDFTVTQVPDTVEMNYGVTLGGIRTGEWSDGELRGGTFTYDGRDPIGFTGGIETPGAEEMRLAYESEAVSNEDFSFSFSFSLVEAAAKATRNFGVAPGSIPEFEESTFPYVFEFDRQTTLGELFTPHTVSIAYRPHDGVIDDAELARFGEEIADRIGELLTPARIVRDVADGRRLLIFDYYRESNIPSGDEVIEAIRDTRASYDDRSQLRVWPVKSKTPSGGGQDFDPFDPYTRTVVENDFPDAEYLSEGWFWADWMGGALNCQFYPWVYVQNTGWLYAFARGENYYFWVNAVGDFAWTTPSRGPTATFYLPTPTYDFTLGFPWG